MTKFQEERKEPFKFKGLENGQNFKRGRKSLSKVRGPKDILKNALGGYPFE